MADNEDLKVAGEDEEIKVEEDSEEIKVAEDNEEIKVAEDSGEIKVAEENKEVTVEEDYEDLKVLEDKELLKEAEDDIELEVMANNEEMKVIEDPKSKEEEVEEDLPNGEDHRTRPVKIKLDFKEDEPEDLARIPPRTHSTDWLDVSSSNRWFTEPAHLNLNGTRKSDHMLMTEHLEKTYNDYLRKHKPWLYTGRPAWSYYYRPWLYYPFNRKYYDKYYDKYRFYDPYYDIYYDDYLDYYSRYKHLYNDSTAVEDYLKSVDKMDNIRHSIDSLRRDLELSELRDDLNRSRRKLRDDLELSRSYRLAAEDLDDVEARALETQVWSEAAPRPRLTGSATPYQDYINTLRLRSLRLEEKRLLEIRRLQELERLRGPQPKWYELKTPQFHKEARKNNELLAAKQQWSDLRDYTESVWRSRDLSRSATHL